jgi:hypothetical protein
VPVPRPEEIRGAMLRDYDALRNQHPAMMWREACRECRQAAWSGGGNGDPTGVSMGAS